MPSGSHGGSSGSHSSGGSSFGGGSGGWRGSSSSSGSSYSGPSRPIHWCYGGRTYYVSGSESEPIRTKFGIGFIILVFAIMCAIWMGFTCKDIHKIKVDRNYYIHMIENAQSDSDYLKEGKVTDKFYNEDCDRWYFTYSIPYGDGSIRELDGYTFSVYTDDEINNIRIGSAMWFAVNNSVVDDKTDSINMDYINIPLENDGEYLVGRRQLTMSIVVLVACVGALAIDILLIVKDIKKKVKRSVDLTDVPEEVKKKSCKYCGRVLQDGEYTCPSCGAARKE